MTARLARNLEKIRLLSQELPADAADTSAVPYIREPDQGPGGAVGAAAIQEFRRSTARSCRCDVPSDQRSTLLNRLPSL